MTLLDRVRAAENVCRRCGVGDTEYADQSLCRACLREVNRAYHASPVVELAEDRRLPAKDLSNAA